MKIMYALVFCLVVITSASSVLSVSLNNDENQDIVMVVEDATSTHHTGMEMTKLEIGKFVLEDGKVLTLSRKSSPSRNCVGTVDPCGLRDWCCEGLTCDGAFDGRCHPTPGCYPEGYTCGVLSTCCYPYKCSTQQPSGGYCR